MNNRKQFNAPLTQRQSNAIQQAIAQNRFVNTLAMECADFTAENRRIARHIVNRGALSGNEPCYIAGGDVPSVERMDMADRTLGGIHACDDCMHNGETIHQGVTVRIR